MKSWMVWRVGWQIPLKAASTRYLRKDFNCLSMKIPMEK